MSIEALKWALNIGEEQGLEPARRLVLIMLGNSADPAGGHLFPSHGYISRRTGLAYSTVRAHVAALQKDGLLIKEPRARDDGGQTSNQYRLAMRQPGLDLDDPLPESSRGGVVASRGPASQRAGGTSDSKVLKQERNVGAGPSPVTACFEAYQHGIKTVHGADYPPSASANGILAGVVRKLGAEPALAVVRAYVASTKPFYMTRKHPLEVLAKDAPTIWVELQQRAGGPARKPPTAARAYLTFDPPKPESRLNDYPVDDPERVAKKVLADYGQRLPGWKAKNIVIEIGSRRSQFSIAELRA